MNDEIIKYNLKGNLSSLRKTNNMTQQQVAEVLGIERSTYSSWELGRSLPKPAQFQKLCKVFDVTFDFLVGPQFENWLEVRQSVVNPYRVKGNKFISELSDHERTIILILRTLTDDNRQIAEDYIKEISEKQTLEQADDEE